ncbi:MAG: hypothetical protein JXR96_29450 [Deltaproteobacteria bacterium]|nr:hypothetical protein [Deltaproteobacteria bacterium]
MSDSLLVFENAAWWQVLLAVGVLGAALGLACRGVWGALSRARQVWLLALRGLGFAALGLLLMGPAIQQRQLSPLKSRLAILVDTSESMGLGGERARRLDRVLGFLKDQAGALARLGERFELDWWAFDRRAEPIAADSLEQRELGPATDLIRALSSAAPSRERDLAGVVLFSDGTDSERLAGMGEDARLPDSASRVIDELGVPVNTFSVDAGGHFSDLAISDLASDGFAFIRNAVEIDVDVTATGLRASSLPLVLEQDGRNLASASVSLEPGETRRVTLKFVPDRVGEFIYRVSIPVQPGERIEGNNARSFVTRIVRDKIRVLHLVGRPAWDERFLRQVLKRNPNIDLVSFFILRTLSDAPGVSQDELSLIPFPVVDLFGKELPTFDIVIFQNFNHGPYQVGFFLPRLRDYVREGGALLMLGGDLSFGSGGYSLTAIEEVLPVELQPDDWRVQEYRAIATPEGTHHPVLDLGDPGTWEQFPPLGSFHLARAVAPGARVLLAHPFERVQGQRAPVLAIREVGRGRSAALLTDGSWRWNFLHAGRGGSPRAYHRFFHNLLRWLIRDPEMESIALRSARTRYQPGEPVRLSVRLADKVEQGSLRMSLRRAEDGQVVQRRPVSLDESGRADLEIDALEPGAYSVRVESSDPSGGLEASDAFVVEGLSRELGHPRPRPDILRAIAEASGGMAGAVENSDMDGLRLRDPERFRVEASTTRPLLEHIWVLAAVISLWALEWFLRRRWGFA